MRNTKVLGVVLSLILAMPALLQAQTAAVGKVVGTVTDPTGAVIPGAEVKLVDEATNLVLTQTTGGAGQYMFPSVAPGLYKLTVTMQGFSTYAMSDLKVEVAKSYNVNVTLQIGAVAEIVEVTS